MNALPETTSTTEQIQALAAAVLQLQNDVRELRTENAKLRCEVGYWKSRHKDALKRNQKLEHELKQAKAEIRQLKHERFGKQSEKSSGKDRSNQLYDPQLPETPKNKRGQQPGRPAPKRRDYSHLPKREEVVDLPQHERCCQQCGKPLADLGYEDPCEQLEIETVVYRRVVFRKRYRRSCDCDQQPQTQTAPAPPKLLPKSRYGTSLWIHLLLEKFDLQRPTHRTIKQLSLWGADLAPGTIADGLKRIEPLLTPVYQALRTRQLEAKSLQADETRWRVFADKAGKTGHLWWLWMFASEDAVVYVLDPSRSHDVPQAHLDGSSQEGVLMMVDRYSGYKAMRQVKEGKLLLAFCWAHVRRDFVRVGKGFEELAPWAVAWLRRIRELYRLDRQRRQAATEAEFSQADTALREHVMKMASARDTELSDTKLRAPCRKALSSLSEHWSGLTLFLDHPSIPLDNNYGERLLRNPAVGRKNYYGSGSEWSGRLSMMMFSILSTLSLWKINPRTWLVWYLEACAAHGGKTPNDIAPFLPWNLSASRLSELQNPPPPDFRNTS